MTRRVAWLLLALLSTIALALYVHAVQGPASVVLISVDSLRADRLGCYGHALPASPHVDRLSREGATFANAWSSTSWTLPAHAALFTGLPDSVHACTDDDRWLDESRTTLPEVLREAGYSTAGFFSGPYLGPAFGFGQGFQRYVDCTSYSTATNRMIQTGDGPTPLDELAQVDVTNATVGREVESWVRSRPPRPAFLFVHVWDVHADYIAPGPYGALAPGYTGPVDGRRVVDLARRTPEMTDADVAHLMALYDAEILWSDALVGRLRRAARAIGGAAGTAIALVSDHGEAFYEHGWQGHRTDLHAEQTQIPLIIAAPRQGRPGRIIDGLAGIIDVAPTLLDVARAGGELPAMGESLADGARRTPLLSELDVPALGQRKVALRDGTHTLLVDLESGTHQVFDDRVDPGERAPLPHGSAPAALVAAYRRVMEGVKRRASAMPPPRDRPPIPRMTEEQLRSLGYLR